MSEHLTIDFAPSEGSVVRIVGLIERRGYQLVGMTMRGDVHAASLNVEIEPRDADRRAPVLAQHISKLVNVSNVTIGRHVAGVVA